MASALEHLDQRGAEGGRRVGDGDAGRAHGFHLVARTALAARDDRAGMTHSAARGGRNTGNEAHNRLLHLGRLQELSRLFFGRTADFTDHDDRMGIGVAKEHLEAVDEVGAIDRVATNADAGGLAKARRRGLGNRFIGERARARHDADRARLVDMARHDADLALARRDDARAVRTDKARPGAGQRALHLHHIEHRNALGDADGKLDARINRFKDRVSCKGRRHIDGGRRSARLFDGFCHRVENRQVEMLRAALAGAHATNHFRAIGNRLFRMERTLITREALADDLGVLVDENGHYAASFTALTIFSAASARLSAEMMGRPDSAMIFLPSSTLVPSSRTTSGTPSETSFAAATTPSAMMSQRMMPPKMLTRMPSTFGSERMILNAAVTFSLVAPPPTSRKFAGSEP